MLNLGVSLCTNDAWPHGICDEQCIQWTDIKKQAVKPASPKQTFLTWHLRIFTGRQWRKGEYDFFFMNVSMSCICLNSWYLDSAKHFKLELKTWYQTCGLSDFASWASIAWKPSKWNEIITRTLCSHFSTHLGRSCLRSLARFRACILSWECRLNSLLVDNQKQLSHVR